MFHLNERSLKLTFSWGWHQSRGPRNGSMCTEIRFCQQNCQGSIAKNETHMNQVFRAWSINDNINLLIYDTNRSIWEADVSLEACLVSKNLEQECQGFLVNDQHWVTLVTSMSRINKFLTKLSESWSLKVSQMLELLVQSCGWVMLIFVLIRLVYLCLTIGLLNCLVKHILYWGEKVPNFIPDWYC